MAAARNGIAANSKRNAMMLARNRENMAAIAAWRRWRRICAYGGRK